MIYITVSRETIIRGLTHEQAVHLVNSFQLVNPMWKKTLDRQGYVGRGVPKFYAYARIGFDNGGAGGKTRSVFCPRGSFPRLLSWCRKVDSDGEVEVVEDIVTKKVGGGREGGSVFTPREYQISVMKELEEKASFALGCGDPFGGIIKLPTGYGKSVIGLWFLRHTGLKGLVIVPNNVILRQFVDEWKRWFGEKEGGESGAEGEGEELGIINGKTKKVGSVVTIATWQSLGSALNRDLVLRLSDEVGMVLVDECHSAVTEKRLAILKQFRPQVLLGMSATPYREEDDGRTPAIGWHFGEIVVEREPIETLTPQVEIIRSRETIFMSEKYHHIVDDMVKNESRNRLIAGLVMGEVLSGRKVLVLTKRIQHYELIREVLPESWVAGEGVYFIDSTDKERDALLQGLKRGERPLEAVFGTVSLLAVGTDIPALDTLIIACDLKSIMLTTQSIGRILRVFRGKQAPKIIDIVDHYNPILFNQARKREKIYRQNGWPVVY